jgi:thiopurine S-methyltransferase
MPLMNVEDWLVRWKEGRIGFHEGRANAFLERHVERLGTERRVLVPLCGKAEDMAFLASRGHEVVGIEVAEDAVRAFFAEHGLDPEVRPGPRVTTFRAGPFTLLAGDVFASTEEDVGPVSALYDRAALVALPDEVRPRYVAHLRRLLSKGATGLLITFEYDPQLMDGPPFSVGEEEVRRLYAPGRVELLGDAPAEAPRFTAAGVPARERCFAMTL